MTVWLSFLPSLSCLRFHNFWLMVLYIRIELEKYTSYYSSYTSLICKHKTESIPYNLLITSFEKGVHYINILLYILFYKPCTLHQNMFQTMAGKAHLQARICDSSSGQLTSTVVDRWTVGDHVVILMGSAWADRVDISDT